jgi:hypothetical protein
LDLRVLWLIDVTTRLTAIRNSPSHSALAGVTGSNAALLARQGAYIAVSTTRIAVRRS